ncbi:hypothetical protein OsI_13456 [Oryza sativa Indica Group]|uniref:Uncharacterized protein n=1 Tax=Oryza sativa subsp. indica TaxID=39946 RepID=A2XLV5_ORYSI|nr:hypothetical protein OsI_13456 [Oryza sativa Indica Group]
MDAPLLRSLPSLGRALLSLSPAPARMLSTAASNALVEIKPGEISMVSGIPKEHLRRKVLLWTYSELCSVDRFSSPRRSVWESLEMSRFELGRNVLVCARPRRSAGSSPRNTLFASVRPRNDVMLKKLGGISPVRLFCDKANMRSAGRRDKPSGMELSIRFWSNSSYTIFVRFASDGGMWLESELWLNRSTVRFDNASSHRGTPPTIEVVVVEVRDVEGGAIAERVRLGVGVSDRQLITVALLFANWPLLKWNMSIETTALFAYRVGKMK